MEDLSDGAGGERVGTGNHFSAGVAAGPGAAFAVRHFLTPQAGGLALVAKTTASPGCAGVAMLSGRAAVVPIVRRLARSRDR